MINKLGSPDEPDTVPVELGQIDEILEEIERVVSGPLGRLFDLDIIVFVERTQRAILDEIPDSRSQEILREQMIGEARNANNLRQWFSTAKQSLMEYKQEKEKE